MLNVGSPGTALVYLGNGDGTFGSPTSYDVGDTPQAIAVADANHDGKLDVLVCNLYDHTVSTLLVLTLDGDNRSEAHAAQ